MGTVFPRLSRCVRGLPFLWLLSFSTVASAAQSFVLEEPFGVFHPEQIITFDLEGSVDPAISSLTAQESTVEVPCQILSGGKKIAIRTDLPAHGRKVWTLTTGRSSPVVEHGVTVATDEVSGWHEITNGITGVRVPLPTQFPQRHLPSPVTAIRLRSGAWLQAEPHLRCTATGRYDLRFIERGPLITSVEVAYSLSSSPGEVPSFYRCTITVQAGQPSILFEEEGSLDASYVLDLGALAPTQARYRGHHSKSKEAGYEANGQQYRQWHMRGGMDAFVDLQSDNPRQFPRMAVWDPWIFDSGWYWQLYNKDAAAGADMVGAFAGRASRALNPSDSGVVLSTAHPNHEAAQKGAAASLRVGVKPAGTPGTIARFQWGLFVGTKADLALPDHIQPIARQMNLHGGINLEKLHRLELDFPDPPQGYGTPYLERATRDCMVAKLRSSPHHYNYFHNAEPGARELLAMWADPSGGKARTVTKDVEHAGREFLESLVNRDGIYTMQHHYWHGGLEMSRKFLWIDQLLASPSLSAEEKRRVKAIAVLFASTLWDNDFVPLDNRSGINLGTPNMPVQQVGFRHQYGLLLSRHPMMQHKVPKMVEDTSQVFTTDINEHGAHLASTHYISAGMGPTLALSQQLKRAGLKDFFRDEERLARFAEFYMQSVTPAEVRFGGPRKNISVGDGSTESSELFGQLAAGFADVKPELSRRLMSVWQQQGKRHSSFHGTTLLKIDEDLPAADPALGSANFPGWFSVFRHGWSTPKESAVWFVNGNHYWDHSHYDQGQLVIYALGAPLSMDWGSLYEPRVAGAFMHSLALPERTFAHPWNQESPPLDSGTWGTYSGVKTVQEECSIRPDGTGWVRAKMTAPDGSFAWTRAVTMALLDSVSPIIAIQDSYSGIDVAAAKVFTMNLMAEGAVETPAGPVRARERIWGYQRHFGDRKELPSSGDVFRLAAGTSRLRFQGQPWKSHATGGIDWELYVVASEDQEAMIGGWGHAWANASDAGEFEAANARFFEERQQILRLRSKNGFRVVLVPFCKGDKPKDVSVEAEGNDLIVKAAGKVLRISPGGSVRQE